MARIYGGPGIFPSNSAVPGYGDELLLKAGSTWTIPAGTFLITSLLGLSMIQQFDPITDTWRPVGSVPPAGRLIQSEGNNYRIANQSGCAVGAFVTTAGSGYTSAPSVLPSAGSSVWASIVGGLLTSVVVDTGGSNYVYPPLVFFDKPTGTVNSGITLANGAAAQPGFMATGYSTLSAGAVSTITLTDQGAGYVSTPQVYLVNDPRDTTGSGATAHAVVGGAGTLSGIVCVDHGNPVTSLPTLTISGGGGASGAATVIADFAVTGLTVGATGTGWPTSSAVIVEPIGQALTGAANTNPTMETSLLLGRDARLVVPTTGGGALTATGATGFGGSYSAAPTAYGVLSAAASTSTLTFTVGGVNDTLIIAQL